ncbi:MAG TPA: fenitrothion hydrolase [Solirubrobacteraceae bacterium]|nr:fenitrothion hydrolase [Solirubrobacteraceae bacterium]
MIRPSGRRSARAPAAAAAVVAATALAAPSAADAHGLVGKTNLPVPEWMFAWAAAIVLVASFAGLAVLWQQPRLARVRERLVGAAPRALEALAGAFGVLVFAVTCYAGLRGIQNPQANLAPTIVFVILWVGFPFASVLFGDVFAAFSPWRAVGRAAGWLAARLGSPAEPLRYPERLGRWPAAVGILAFAWVELVYVGRDDPSNLAVLGLVYAAVQLVGMALYGVRQWCDNADPFGVYFGMLARLAPLRWHDRRLYLRPPATALVEDRPVVAGSTALVLVSIGTTSFDGFSQGTAWADVAGRLVSFFQDLGLHGEAAIEAAFTVGLLAAVAIVAGFYLLGIAGMRSAARAGSTRELARAFSHTLWPIAFAYVFAHYFSLLAWQGQAVGYLASDPLGHGSDLLGTAGWAIDYNWIGATAIWYLQVLALIGGHVTGLALAHERALTLFRDGRVATRSQYWMLTVMVGFTCLALWLISVASQ